jgi:hypothetical protein
VEINIPVGFEITEMGLDLWISSDKIDESLYFPYKSYQIRPPSPKPLFRTNKSRTKIKLAWENSQ